MNRELFAIFPDQTRSRPLAATSSTLHRSYAFLSLSFDVLIWSTGVAHRSVWIGSSVYFCLLLLFCCSVVRLFHLQLSIALSSICLKLFVILISTQTTLDA